MLERTEGPGASTETAICQASPYPATIDATLEVNCQMIAMGTHGHSGPAHLLLEKVAEYVIRVARCLCPLFACIGHNPNAGC